MRGDFFVVEKRYVYPVPFTLMFREDLSLSFWGLLLMEVVQHYFCMVIVLLTLNSLISECRFDLLFSLHFQWYRPGEFFEHSRASRVGVYLL